jgi:hypothetical protein
MVQIFVILRSKTSNRHIYRTTTARNDQTRKLVEAATLTWFLFAESGQGSEVLKRQPQLLGNRERYGCKIRRIRYIAQEERYGKVLPFRAACIAGSLLRLRAISGDVAL